MCKIVRRTLAFKTFMLTSSAINIASHGNQMCFHLAHYGKNPLVKADDVETDLRIMSKYLARLKKAINGYEELIKEEKKDD